MSDDLVKQLRAAGNIHFSEVTLCAEAADEIERLRADNERLTDKLAKIAEQENYN
jgi:hypothetical protein